LLEMKIYTKLGYKLTKDDYLLDDGFGTDEQLRLQLKKLFNEIRVDKNKPIISWLEELIKEYPDAPLLKISLAATYRKEGEPDKARRQYEQLISEHPRYLYGRIEIASFLLGDNAYDKIEELLGADMDVRTLFPEREVFHLSEVSDFLRISILYFIGTDQVEKAEAKYKDLEAINKNYPDLSLLFMQLTFARLGKYSSAKKGEMEKLRKVFPQKRAEKSENISAPVFHHGEIDKLYRYDAQIPQDVLQEILELPRASLISDLEKVLDDTVDRYGHFSQTDLQVEGNCFFALHAFFLLAELRAEESLPKVLSILAYDDDFVDFWFGDYLTEDMWIYFYRIGFSRFDEMKNFLFNPGVNSFAKCCIISAMVQTVLHNPKKKEEITEIYVAIFDYYLNELTGDAENDINSDFIGALIDGAINGKFKGLLPQIKELYDKGYVADIFSVKDYKRVLYQMNKDYDYTRDVMDIYTIYQCVTGTWNKDDKQADKYNSDDYVNYDYAPIQPATSIKIGRNDPCPCGSGKKYKKCCLDKEDKG
jgi:tetratricopeptide (TPR) repeat protein